MESMIERWNGLEGLDLLEAVLQARSLKTVVSTSFGAESAVLLDLVAQVDPKTPVVFVDTRRLFDETHAYRLELTRHLGLSNVRVVQPAQELVRDVDRDGSLFERDPDLCCQARKVMPYAQAMAEFDVIVTGRKRQHGGLRATLPTAEREGAHIKVNPLAHCSSEDIEQTFANRRLPRHPLSARGYASIGCAPCTSKACVSQGTRSGRWPGRDKTECGIHLNFNTLSIRG